MPYSLVEFFKAYRDNSGAPWSASLRGNGQKSPALLQSFYNDMIGAKHSAPPIQSKIGYIDWLKKSHDTFAPDVYLEIGVSRGKSLKLATKCKLAVGIDPTPQIEDPIFGESPFRIIRSVSDAFFLSSSEILGGRKINLSFIDGLHIFEFVLRDFIGCEALSESNGVVAIHDVLPRSPAQAARNRFTNAWTGDVWRIVYVLKHFRPDLLVEILPHPPTGLAIIKGLNPANTLLRENYLDVVKYGLSISCVDFFNQRGRQFSIVEHQPDGMLTDF